MYKMRLCCVGPKYAETPIASLFQHNQIALFARPIVVDFVRGHNRHGASTFPSLVPSTAVMLPLNDNLIFKIEQLNTATTNRSDVNESERRLTHGALTKFPLQKTEFAKSTNCFY